MKISFGKIIPVKVYIDNKETQDEKEVRNVTNILCANLRRQKHYDNTYLMEQQRRFFSHIIKDYKVPKSASEQALKNDNQSNVIPLNIVNPDTNKKERYIVTGHDIEIVRSIQEDFGDNKKNGVDIQTAYQGLQNNLNALIKAKGTLLNKTLLVSAQTNSDAKLEKEKYKINLIDFIG